MLLGGLDVHDAHVGSSNCLADRLGIERIVLVGLDVGLDELRRHHLDGVPERGELGGPEVGAAACLDANDAGLESSKERSELIAAHLFAKRRIAAFVDTVNLEHVFGQVQSTVVIFMSCLHRTCGIPKAQLA